MIQKNRMHENKMKQKNKEEMKKTSGIAIAFCLALALILFMIFFVNIPISPMHETTGREVKFDWIGLGNRAFIDSDQRFNDASEIRKGETIEMGPGKYYWKISETGATNPLVIESEVSIMNQGGMIKNTGNVKILVEFFKKIGLTSKAVLDVGDSSNIEDDKSIIASQYDDSYYNKTNETKNETR